MRRVKSSDGNRLKSLSPRGILLVRPLIIRINRMTSRLPALLPLAALVAVAACGDPTRARAEAEVRVTSVALYALNGSPANAPVGFAIINGSLQPLDQSFAADVVVDLDSQGRVLLYPIRLVASPIVSSITHVGIQKVGERFDALTRAPSSGYRTDSATVLRVGETAAIEVTSQLCSFSLMGVSYYGKFSVDSVALASRRIYGKLGINPNCGFRSLVPGLPKE